MSEHYFEVICGHISNIRECVAEIASSANWAARPSVLYRPKLSIDGDQWCALYGENLQEGIAGFGDTPADAMRKFDTEFMFCKVAQLKIAEDQIECEHGKLKLRCLIPGCTNFCGNL